MALFQIVSLNISMLQIISLAIATLLLAICIQRRYSHLRDIPGPFVASFSASLWQLYYILTGHTEVAIIQQHLRHGIGNSNPEEAAR